MFLSHYAHIFSWPDDPELRLVYSTRTGSKALIPAQILDDIKAQSLDKEDEETLTELGLVVKDRDQEQEEALGMVQEINSLRQVMSVSVILNLHCNFRCRYCYEGSQKSRRFMSTETADQLVAHIKERFEPGMTKLILDFYGGEPLLSIGLIKHIAGSLKPFIKSRGGTFECSLVTNGSLLTPKVVEQLVAVGLKRAKITIDGPPENHNFFRPYRSGGPTFDRIIGNIRECCDLINIGISGNFTKDNFEQFPLLFDHLLANNLTPDRVYRLSFSPVLQVNDDFSSGFCGGCASCNEEWLGKAAPFLRGEILKKGYRTGDISPSLCMVDVDNSFVVHYDGTIYQCVAMIGHNEYSCGDIWSGMTDYRQKYHLDHWQQEEECTQCPYLPLCFGGCRYMAFQRDGHMEKVDCQKNFFNATLEHLIRQDITYEDSVS